MSLNCIIAMGDRLQGREDRPQEMTSSEQQETTGDTNSQNTGETLYKLTTTVFNQNYKRTFKTTLIGLILW